MGSSPSTPTISLCAIAAKYSVSDNAIRKLCKKLNVEVPKHESGYWAKVYSGKINIDKHK